MRIWKLLPFDNLRALRHRLENERQRRLQLEAARQQELEVFAMLHFVRHVLSEAPCRILSRRWAQCNT